MRQKRQPNLLFDAALALRNDALADVDAVIAGLPSAAWPHLLKALMLTKAGREDESWAASQRAEALRSDPPTDEDVAEGARLAAERGEMARAAELYSELIRRHPDSVFAIDSRAKVYEKLGEGEKAQVDFRVALGLDPRYDRPLIDLARRSTDRGLFDDAEANVKRALEIDPENPFALEAQGRVLHKRGEEARVRRDVAKARAFLEGAERATRAALERSPALLWAELNLGGILAERAKLSTEPDPELMSRAIDSYQKVLSGFTSVPISGQQREVYIAAQLVAISPEDAGAHYNLAGAHALAGQTKEALDALENDLKLGDTDWKYLAEDPWFASLRGDPRYQAILAEMKKKAG